MILAIDSSIGTSVAVVTDTGEVLVERSSDNTRGHAEAVGLLIADALASAEVARHAANGCADTACCATSAKGSASAGGAARGIGAVVAGVGPGPFTGLRVGIAAARAFAIGRGIPVLGVLSHDACAPLMAEARCASAAAPAPTAARPSVASGPYVILSDARRREQYWTAYSGLDTDGLPVVAAGPGLSRPDGLDAQLGGLAAAPRILAESVSAGELGRIAAIRRLRGLPDAGLEPRYLRSPDVTLSAGPKRVTA